MSGSIELHDFICFHPRLSPGLDFDDKRVHGLVQLLSQGHVGLDGDQGQVCRLARLGRGAYEAGVSSVRGGAGTGRLVYLEVGAALGGSAFAY